MKKKIRKIMLFICCFVLIIGSCMSVSAAKISATKLQDGNSFDVGLDMSYVLPDNVHIQYESLRIKGSINSGNDIYAFFAHGYSGNSEYSTDTATSFFLVSKSPFTVSFNFKSLSSMEAPTSYKDIINDSMTSQTVQSVSYGTTTYYYTRVGVATRTATTISVSDSLGSFCNAIDLGINLTISRGNGAAMLFEKLYLADFTWDDGHGGGGGSFAEYEDTPTGSIEPPKNLSIYRGYSTSDRQYKFQLQWEKPEDLELYTEITAQIHYKNGSEHVYSNYVVEGRDGWSAQDNKYTYYENDLINDFFEYKEIDKPSVYNIEKLYVRFCKLVDGKFQYSLWRMVDYINLDSGNGYDAGEDDYIADSITGSFDENGNWKDQSVNNGEIVDGAEKENAKSPGLDVDGNNVAPPNKDILNPDTWGIDFASVFQKFLEAMKEAISFIGEFPKAISEFFGFLPPYVIGCVIIGILAAILLRILGR